MKSKDSKQRLFEVMQRVAPNFTQNNYKKILTDFPNHAKYVNPVDSPQYKWYQEVLQFIQGNNNVNEKAELAKFFQNNFLGIDYDILQTPAETVSWWLSPEQQEFIKGEMNTSGSESELSEENPVQQPVAEKFNKWGKSQDDWADIEGSHTERGKDLQKKANLSKKEPQGGEDTPEYMNTYDSEKPQRNINNLSQTQIDKTNTDKRGDMERDVRRSIDREDGMYESVKKKDTKQRLLEVMQKVDPTFKPKLL